MLNSSLFVSPIHFSYLRHVFHQILLSEKHVLHMKSEFMKQITKRVLYFNITKFHHEPTVSSLHNKKCFNVTYGQACT